MKNSLLYLTKSVSSSLMAPAAIFQYFRRSDAQATNATRNTVPLSCHFRTLGTSHDISNSGGRGHAAKIQPRRGCPQVTTVQRKRHGPDDDFPGYSRGSKGSTRIISWVAIN